MLTAVTLILAGILLALIAVVMGWVLGWANRVFHLEVDPLIETIRDILPGTNCGACGYAGCYSYAAVLAGGEESNVTLCGPGGPSCAQRVADVLGISITEVWPYKAVVHCAARWDDRLLKMEYVGENTCGAANLVAGFQGCTYGCLGIGDCVDVCGYNAINIVDGLATVDYEKCTGCRLCAAACPRNIITMVPFKQSEMLVVACSNQDFGKEVQKVCRVGCIGCTLCARESDLVEMEGDLPVICYDDYDDCEDFEVITARCPRASLIYVGTPTEEQIAEVADEEVPPRIEVDFKTTVDETEWRG